MRSRPIPLIGLLLWLLMASVASGQVSSGEFTYAVEINGVICGYADVRLSSVDGDDGVYTLFEQNTFVMLSALGSEFNTTADVIVHIDPATGDFTFMRAHIQQADFVLESEVRINGSTAVCTSSLLDDQTIVTLPEGVIIGNPLYSLHLLRDFVRDGLREKTCQSLDAREFMIDEVTFTRAGRETLELAGKRYDAVIVDIMSHSTGVKIRAWIDTANGMTLKSADPRGQMAYLADPSVKKRVELVNMDENILARTNVSIPDVHRISYMKVKAVLEPTGQWITPEDLNVPGQRFTGSVTDNLIEGVFEIEHPHFDGMGAPPYPALVPGEKSLGAYLRPSEFIESADPILIEEARRLAAGSGDSWEAVCRLSQWVADEISYEIPGGGTARRTYDLRAGECGSHSILLATFCRAVGIPARVVWGCMYTPNLGGAFGQHAWTEVHMGAAGWIPVDSTAHEAGFVDSGHIRLGEHRSLSIALNAKSMEVLDHRVASATDDAGPGADAEQYAAYVGAYDPPGGGEPFEVLVARGNLAISIPGRQVLAFEDPGSDGRWYCTLTRNLFCTFERDDVDQVVGFQLHELVRMRRIADPDAIGDDVPDRLRPYLGDYRFPGRPEPFAVSLDDGRLAVWYQSRQALVHMDPTEEKGRWIDEHGGNFLTFDRDTDGRISSLILEVVSAFRRRSSFQAPAGVTVAAAASPTVNDIDTVLDDFNRAATNTDVDAYFACLAPGAVFIGTDATERWTVDELRRFVKPYFDQGQGRAHTPRDRHVDLLPGGEVACFDELVEIESLGECRGTGVMVKLDDAWLIAQYSLSVPVPNEIVFDVVGRIREHLDEPKAPSADDETAGIRESLEAYLASATWPEPKSIDPELFATDIEALWSNGKTYRGRESVLKALEESQRELETAFETFGARAEQVRVQRRGDVAWVTCRIRMNGTQADGGGAFSGTVRSSFVFEHHGHRWQMASEHSSRVADDQRR